MADKNEKPIKEVRNDDHSYKIEECRTTTNEVPTSGKIFKGDKDLNNDRHNNNARSTAVLESEEYPRINTDNL